MVCIDSVLNAYRYKRIELPENLRQDVFKAPETLAMKPESPTAEEVIKVIRKEGGVAILSHPNNRMHLVKELVAMGLNGIETDHPSLTEETASLSLEAAKTFKLYSSGGTDHTGPMSGCSGRHARPVFNSITEEEFYTIKDRCLG